MSFFVVRARTEVLTKLEDLNVAPHHVAPYVSRYIQCILLIQKRYAYKCYIPTFKI